MRLPLILLLIVILPACASGHGGGQDANGGHVDRSTGEYHCHQPDCVPPTPTEPEEDVDVAPDGEEQPTITIAGSWRAAKRRSRDTIYLGQDTTFYCGCQYGTHTDSGGAAITNAMLDACNYDPDDESFEARANRRASPATWNGDCEAQPGFTDHLH